jgi:hypothetical protein
MHQNWDASEECSQTFQANDNGAFAGEGTRPTWGPHLPMSSMSTALPWLPASSSSPLLSSLPPPAPNTTIPKDIAVLSHAIGFHRLNPYTQTNKINLHRKNPQTHPKIRDKNAGQGLHLFEESKVIKINRSEALPTESLQSRV